MAGASLEPESLLMPVACPSPSFAGDGVLRRCAGFAQFCLQKNQFGPCFNSRLLDLVPQLS